MNVDAYLERIGAARAARPDAGALRRLHRAHLLAVPFENLDIPLGNEIALHLPRLFDKIVTRGRGGFCYELNGLFAWLLAELGYQVTLLSARVYAGGAPGLEFDHLCLRVDLGRAWLADVGFGDSFVEPLPLDSAALAAQQLADYRLREHDDGARVLEQRQPGQDFEPQYLFTLRQRRLSDFAPMCTYHQTSPASPFTRKSVCSRATVSGRVTLSNGRLIETVADPSAATKGQPRLPLQRSTREIASADEYRHLLASRFGIRLEPGADVDKLLKIGGS